ncbi:MAG: response regulator [Candidatus Eisenbacteria bacterium]|nr:response regulator [Candidatus Eisenbacteria bacterium]
MAASQVLEVLGRELSTPLNNMLNMAAFLLETELSSDQRQMVAGAHRSGQRLLRLVRDALDSVEAETGKVRPALIPFDLRVITEEIATLLGEHAQEKDKTVDLRVHHEVPSRLVGDPGRLRQVLWNLGEHSLECHGAGNVVLRAARLHEDKGSVVLRLGFRFYDAFQSGRSTTGAASGGQQALSRPAVADVGTPELRLAIAQRLAGVMGARVVVEEEPDRVQHIWFDLKLGKQEEAPSVDAPTPSCPSLAGQRVLLVDPSEAIRHALAARLESWGCLVSQAALAEDAVRQVDEASTANEPFHFLLIERDLPYMSSLELGAYLRARTAGDALRMVLFAGVGRPGDLDLARSSGFNAYLPKHVDDQDLGEALAEIERVALASPRLETRPLVTRHWLAEIRRSRMRILIVDDDVVSIMVTDWTMRRIGFQVVRVGSAGEVRQLLHGDAAPFDLVILALRLPDADGMSVIEEIRAAGPGARPPAIVALGYECTSAERVRCQEAGADAYIPRPVDLANLCEIVEAITRTAPREGSETSDSIEDGGGPLAMAREQWRERDRISFKSSRQAPESP